MKGYTAKEGNSSLSVRAAATVAIIIIVGLGVIGCNDKLVKPATDVIDEFVDDTTNDTTGADTTDTNSVDVVEVVAMPCADWEWLNNDFWCCPNGGQCEWRTCSITESEGQCLVFCEKTLNNKPVDYPLVVFSPPNSFIVTYYTGDTASCSL